jgi:hypothetical protein
MEEIIQQIFILEKGVCNEFGSRIIFQISIVNCFEIRKEEEIIQHLHPQKIFSISGVNRMRKLKEEINI